MPTDPLTASRYPASTASPNVNQDIQNAVMDLADNTIPRFATTAARDTAYSAYVAAGGTLANGMLCWCTSPGTYYTRQGGAWLATSLAVPYYAEAAGGGAIGTAATTPTAPASVALPAGTYDVDFLMTYVLSVSTARTMTMHLSNGTTDLATTSFTVNDTAVSASRSFTSFKRVTLASAATLSVRASAGATGGTQNMSNTSIRAVRVG